MLKLLRWLWRWAKIIFDIKDAWELGGAIWKAIFTWKVGGASIGGGLIGLLTYAAAGPIFAGIAAVAGFGVVLFLVGIADKQRPVAAPPEPSPPIGIGWLETQLIAAGFDETEVRRDAVLCLESLKRAGIITQRATLAFIADNETREELQQIYRDELNDRTRILDPDGFCRWGPLLHQAAPQDKDLVRLQLRADIRAYVDPATGREKTREVQAREAIAAGRGILERVRATPTLAEQPMVFGEPEQHGGRPHLSWWCVRVTVRQRMTEGRIYITYEQQDHPTCWQPEVVGDDRDHHPEVLTMEAGQSALVAVVMRATERCAEYSLPPYVARLCTRPFYGIRMWMREPHVEPARGVHEVRLRVKSAEGEHASPPYWLTVPDTTQSNRDFALSFDRPTGQPPERGSREALRKWARRAGWVAESWH